MDFTEFLMMLNIFHQKHNFILTSSPLILKFKENVVTLT